MALDDPPMAVPQRVRRGAFLFDAEKGGVPDSSSTPASVDSGSVGRSGGEDRGEQSPLVTASGGGSQQPPASEFPVMLPVLPSPRRSRAQFIPKLATMYSSNDVYTGLDESTLAAEAVEAPPPPAQLLGGEAEESVKRPSRSSVTKFSLPSGGGLAPGGGATQGGDDRPVLPMSGLGGAVRREGEGGDDSPLSSQSTGSGWASATGGMLSTSTEGRGGFGHPLSLPVAPARRSSKPRIFTFGETK